MIYTNKKNAYILLLTSTILVIMTFTIGGFVKYTSEVTSLEFHKDLAKLRGYWAAYSVKESNISNTFIYNRLGSADILYHIEATRVNDTNITWSITNSTNSGIQDDMVFKRTLVLETAGDSNRTLQYLH
jgi:hypothetical protein